MTQETVLVVEDNQDMQTFLRDAVLEPAGYHVVTTSDGREGLKEAVEGQPDLIVLDLQMPRLSGIELLRVLDQNDVHIPTIVISAYGSEEAILQAFRLGAKDFLQKPFTMDEAQHAVENALTEERLRREKENLTKALALANRRLQRQVRNWSALNDIALTMTSTLEESEVYHRVIESVNRILRVEAGSLLLVDRETGQLAFAATTKGNAERLVDLRLAIGEGIAGWVAEHGEPVIVPNPNQDPRFYAKIDEVTGFQSQAILCVPLKSKERTIGVLEVINKLAGPRNPSFTQGDLELLTMLASWVTVAVENAQLNRATAQMAAATALGQAVAAMAHHINNRLMTFSLHLDRLEREQAHDKQTMNELVTAARQCIHDVSDVIKALDRLEEIQTVPYIGDREMIDLEGILSTTDLTAPHD
jgi:two-component system NtrC family sensor kinase